MGENYYKKLNIYYSENRIMWIYFNTTLQYMMFFMIKQDEEYLRKAKERMRITRRCIDTIGNKKHD